MTRFASILVLALTALPALAHAQLSDGEFGVDAQQLAALEGDVGVYLGPVPALGVGGQQGEDVDGGQTGSELADGGQTGSEVEAGTEPLGGLVTSPMGFFDIFLPFSDVPGAQLLLVHSGGDEDAYILGGACEREPCYAGRRVLASASRSTDALPDGRVVTTVTVVASAPE